MPFTQTFQMLTFYYTCFYHCHYLSIIYFIKKECRADVVDTVIPATGEVEIRRIAVPDQPKQTNKQTKA